MLLTDVLSWQFRFPFSRSAARAEISQSRQTSDGANGTYANLSDVVENNSQYPKWGTIRQRVRDSLVLLEGGSEPLLNIAILTAESWHHGLYNYPQDKEDIVEIIAKRVAEKYKYATYIQPPT